MENYKEKLAEIINSENTPFHDIDVLIKYFPELKESEDEKIRKEIIEYLRLKFEDPNAIRHDYDKWIACLEKQKEVKMIQWTGDNLKEVTNFTGISPEFSNWFKSWDDFESYVHSHNDVFKLFFEDGSHYEVPKGAWIIRTPDGYNVASRSKFVEKQGEQKPTWSEEDEKMLKDTISCLSAYKSPDIKGLCYQEQIDWLKSLKPCWKPSDEQLKTLCDAIVYVEGCHSNFRGWRVLESLYNELKQL